MFVEQVPAPGREMQWQVTAIRISADDRTAILNGKLVREGDTVNSGQVMEIKPRSVVVNTAEQKLIVKLLSTEVKKEYTKYR